MAILGAYLAAGFLVDEKHWLELKAALTRGKEMLGFLTGLCGLADLGAGGKLFAHRSGLAPLASSSALVLVGASLMAQEGAWGLALGAGTMAGVGLVAARFGIGVAPEPDAD